MRAPGDRDPDRLDRELDDEVGAHLEMRAEELVRQGLDPGEARREAERRFGDTDALRRAARHRDRRLRVAGAVEDVRRDLAYALRRIARAPGAAALEVAVFALGVGLTTATFTVVDRVLLRPLALPAPERLVSLESMDSLGGTFPRVSMSNWYDWREGSRTLEATGLHNPDRAAVTVGGRAFRVATELVVGDFFEAVRMPLVAGRYPAEADVQAGEIGVVVSEGFWRRELGGRPVPVTMGVGSERLPVVGVVRRGYAYPEGTDLWLPRPARRVGGAARNSVNFHGVGRMAPGVTSDEVRDELSRIARGIMDTDPVALYSHGVGVTPLRDFVVGDARRPLWLLMGAVVSLLLAASVNLAALNLARAVARSRETAVRRALGAGRRRLVKQELTRHLLVAGAGGVLGVALAAGGLGLLVSTGSAPVPRAHEIVVDGRIAAAGLLVTFLAGFLAAVAPSLRAASGSLASWVGAARGVGGSGRGRSPLTGGPLVAVEVGLAVLLIAASAVLIRDFRALTERDLGFDPEQVITAEVSLSGDRFNETPETRTAWWDEAVRAVGELPGVTAVGVTNAAPTTPRGQGFIDVDGWEGPTDGAGYVAVHGEYFETLGIPLVEGRLFDDRDGPDTERVVVANEVMAARYWPGASALGGRVKALSMEGYGADEPAWLTVVGVVGSVRHYGFQDDVNEEMYVLAEQVPFWAGSPDVLVRAASAPGPLARDVAETLRRIDPSLAVETRLLADRLAAPLAQQTLLTSLIGVFGVLATLLASLGVYGVIAFAVSRRTREMGVRAALGARRSELVGLVLRSALRVSLFGVVGGLGAGWLLREVLSPQLNELSPGDPVAFVAAGLLLLGVATLAALRPAWRAATMDPRDALLER